MTTKERYNYAWFEKKICQNKAIRDFLIKMIKKHKESDFPWSEEKLLNLSYEDLAEISIATVNKSLNITNGKGEDYDDQSDTKFVISQHRNNIKLDKKTGKSHWMNTYPITGVNGKNG